MVCLVTYLECGYQIRIDRIRHRKDRRKIKVSTPEIRRRMRGNETEMEMENKENLPSVVDNDRLILLEEVFELRSDASSARYSRERKEKRRERTI